VTFNPVIPAHAGIQLHFRCAAAGSTFSPIAIAERSIPASPLISRVAPGNIDKGIGAGFAAKYGVNLLVHAENYLTIEEAIAREKAIKKWRRDWKIELIENENPDWLDRYELLIGL